MKPPHGVSSRTMLSHDSSRHWPLLKIFVAAALAVAPLHAQEAPAAEPSAPVEAPATSPAAASPPADAPAPEGSADVDGRSSWLGVDGATQSMQLPAAGKVPDGKVEIGLTGTSLTSWKDPSNFKDQDLLGGKRFLMIEGKKPVEVTSGLHVGPFRKDAQAAAWVDKVSIDTRYEQGPRPGTIDVVVTVENTTRDLISLKASPLYIWLGPLGPLTSSQTQPPVLKGRVGDSEVTPTPGTPLDEDCKYVAFQAGFTTHILEQVDGPGRFLVETVQAAKDAKGEGVTAENLIIFRPVKEIRGLERFTVRLRLFAGLTSAETLTAAGYPELFQLWSGITGPIGFIMFQLLKIFYGLSHSWGIAIILLTVFVKVLLHPLNRKQIESMAKMQEIQPKMQAIQTRYAHDQQKMQQEIQKLWAESGANPFSGCLPMLVQLPIFIALYSCLGNAPDLRGVPFLWLPDLSAPDPLFVLPVLFAGGIYFSGAQNATDESQKTMMQVMPLFLLIFMVNVSSGVMIYLAGQTVLGYFEQKHNAKLRDELKAKGGPASATDSVVDNEVAAQARKGSKYKEKLKAREEAAQED